MSIGLIGAGPRAKILARAAEYSLTIVPPNESSRFFISRVTSKTPSSSLKFADEWKRNANDPRIISSTLNDILTDPEIESVIIAAPIEQQPELIYQALLNNKNIFVEKPGPISSHEAQAFYDISLDRKLIVAVGFSWIDEIWSENFSFLPDWSKIEITWQRPLVPEKAPVALNLAVHPISWLAKVGPITGGVFKPTVEVKKSAAGIRYELDWSRLNRKANINLIESENQSREILIQMKSGGEYFIHDNGKALATSPGRPTSAQRQMKSFFEAIREKRVVFHNDLPFAYRVLKIAEVAL